MQKPTDDHKLTNPMNYYNENDKKAAAWIRHLIAAKLIPNGHVDERSIIEVRGSDLEGYTQCHFFAGICGWSLALKLAGWPEDRPVWTGSCPCQPFSAAGKQLGVKDERHLWPEFRRLIAECRPSITFGEQVTSKAGRDWLSEVRVDLEELGYAVGASDLCAAGIGEKGAPILIESANYLRQIAERAEATGRHELAGALRDSAIDLERTIIGAPHIRQRLFWVADAGSNRCGQEFGESTDPKESRLPRDQSESDGESVWIGEPDRNGWGAGQLTSETARHRDSAEPASGASGLANASDIRRAQHERESRRRPTASPGDATERASVSGMGDTASQGFTERIVDGGIQTGTGCADEGKATELRGNSGGMEYSALPTSSRLGSQCEQLFGSTNNWSEFELIHCTDGKARRTKPGLQPLAYGVSGRVAKLRGIGNSIVPEVAAEFIKSYIEII